MVLMDDRGISEDILTNIQNDICEVLHKYIEFKPMTLSLKSASVNGDDGIKLLPVLSAEIPISGFKRYI